MKEREKDASSLPANQASRLEEEEKCKVPISSLLPFFLGKRLRLKKGPKKGGWRSGSAPELHLSKRSEEGGECTSQFENEKSARLLFFQ